MIHPPPLRKRVCLFGAFLCTLICLEIDYLSVFCCLSAESGAVMVMGLFLLSEGLILVGKNSKYTLWKLNEIL